MKIEPSSDLRQAAKFLYQMFIALVEGGFSEHQALVVIGEVITNPHSDKE